MSAISTNNSGLKYVDYGRFEGSAWVKKEVGINFVHTQQKFYESSVGTSLDTIIFSFPIKRYYGYMFLNMFACWLRNANSKTLDVKAYENRRRI